MIPRSIHRLAILCTVLLLGATLSALAIEEIKPPFELSWGESTDRMERLLLGAKAKIADRRTVGGCEVWDVEGLKQVGLRRTSFYFRKGELVEVELQYQMDEWDEPKYDQYMGQVRQRLEQRFGTGSLIARKQEPIADVVQKVVGWKWDRNNSSVELFYFAAQNATQVFRTLSVHFKTH